MACAEEERSRVDGIVSKVIAEIRRSLGTRDGAAPEDWIGVRVRLSTHRCVLTLTLTLPVDSEANCLSAYLSNIYLSNPTLTNPT